MAKHTITPAVQERFEEFLHENALSHDDAARLLGPATSVPVTIFANDTLTPLEALVKYLHENHSTRLVRIAELTGRDQRAIGTTYHRAARKMRSRIIAAATQYHIPLRIMPDERLSPFERIATHLHERYALTYHEIALLLKRDDRTIWTVCNRAAAKRRKAGR